MKKRINFKLLAVMFTVSAMLFTVACSDDDDGGDSKSSKSKKLRDYLISENLDLPDILADYLITADTLNADLDSYYVIDVRSAADYATGHIPDAVNATADTLIATAAECPADKQIVVTCYKGIGATRMVVALRLSGYEDAQSLKWGMSSWRDEDQYDKWSGAVDDLDDDYPTAWVDDDADPATPEEHDYPSLGKTSSSGAAVLDERVGVLLSDGYPNTAPADILADPSSYFINNYWPEEKWDLYGHIAGAYRIYDDGVLSLEEGGIAYLDPEETIVTYCWTSQTSGMISAYLTVLGYDVENLSTGANGMIYTTLTESKWAEQGFNYAVEAGK